jgi:ketosteroid isomerase-like protein
MSQAGRKHPTTQHDRRPAVQAFLDRFGALVTAGDGAAIAQLWETPAYVLGDTMAMPVTSPEEVATFFGGAKPQYNERGITDTRAEIQRETWHTDRLVSVEVRWPYLDAEGAAHGSETSTYVLRVDDAGQLRLRVAIMHGATEA